MDNNDEFVLSDEAIAEQEKATVADDTKLRSEIVEYLGFTDNEDDNAEIVDKIFEREKKLRSGYGELLGKKYIPLKKAYKSLVDKPQADGEKSTVKEEFDPEKFSAKVQAETFNTINEQFLDDSEFSDDFKVKVREELGRNPGKTVQSLLKNSDYLKFHLEQEQKENKTKEAAKNGTTKAGATDTEEGEMPDKFRDPHFMATEEGRKEFDEYLKKKK